MPIKVLAKINQYPKKYTIPLVISTLLLVFYGIIFGLEKPVSFSYGGSSCVPQLTLFPGIHKVSGNEFAVSYENPVTIGSFTIASRTACFNPLVAPSVKNAKVSTSPFGWPLMRKTFAIAIGKPPVANIQVLNEPIATTKPLQIPLNEDDRIFSYGVYINNKIASCAPTQKAVACDIPVLKLSQSKKYSARLIRHFQGTNEETIVAQNVQTLSAVRVAKSTIKHRSTVYSKPKTVTLTLDKEMIAANASLVQLKGKQRASLTVKSSVQAKTLKIELPELPRSASFELVVDNAEAVDGSGFESPYKLTFKTSGGPKVSGINIGAIGVIAGTTAVVTFDQALLSSQDTKKLIVATGGASVVSKSSNQVFINLSNVPRCGSFSITIAKGMKSKHGIVSESSWKYSGRMVCHTVTTIGYSSQGRAINAYRFGSGPSTVLYTGTIHGNEYSTKLLMERWINELEVNVKSIPSNKSIIIIPQINPDGVSRGSRVNARNVDLNRNFATNDWKKDITTVNNTPFPGGGGKAPMSEPETKALAAYVQRIRPVLILSYHSVGGLVAANQAGSSSSLATQYSRLSGYRNATGQSDDAFEYSISGTADDWYAQKMGTASILVELGSHSYDQFYTNQRAMWAMAKS